MAQNSSQTGDHQNAGGNAQSSGERAGGDVLVEDSETGSGHPGRTPGKAEGVDNPEKSGNE